MNKNKIKNIAVFAGTIILSGTISYSAISKVFNVKPFTHNKYSIYKIDLKEYKEKDVITNSCYSKDGNFNKQILTNSVFIKTPYYTDKNGNIIRDIYSYDISSLSEEDIEFMKENSVNDKAILDQDYMKLIKDALNSDYSLLNNVSGLHYINSETISDYIPNNEFEIYYTEYDTNSNEIIYYDSKESDIMLNIDYTIGNLLFAGIIYSIYYKINNKKKVKVFDNTKEE